MLRNLYVHLLATADAQALFNEIGSSIVNNVQQYVETDNGIIQYPGTNFTLVPGEAYFVSMGSAKSWTPSHY